ncbi:MAG TPA: alpha/beta hydrolase [Gemmatimonadaceae bacterium]|nr:alpha/beta hydrolase [Gemmatimonadaceae bacterium]
MSDSPFEGFETIDVDVGETTIHARRSGSGPPLLLLHGFPETHLMWRRVAPLLADRLSVVCADLRGYGASAKPPSAPDHAPYAKRAMARDLVALMSALGFDRFAVAGHDRGGRVAYRLALDHPTRIDRLAVLDIVPTLDALHRADARLALSFWPWWLLAQPAPLPERLILGAPEAVIDDAVGQWGSDASSFPPAIRSAYVAALRDPATVHAICEEYRAAATLDVAHDAADRDAGRRITCPTLVLWARGGGLDEWYADVGGPLGVWRDWATDVAGRAIDGGHFFPEQSAAETAAALRDFFSR